MSLRTIVALLVGAVALIVADSQTGARGWGMLSAFLLMAIGTGPAWVHPLFRYYPEQRLADIDEFEPDLLESLNRGPVSRRVLKAMRRWTEDEEPAA